MLLLIKEELKLHQHAKLCYICWKRILKFTKDQHYKKVRDLCHYTRKHKGTTHSICNLKLNVPNEIAAVFYNGSNYDRHFIIKELAKKFEEQFDSLGENAEKVSSNRKGSNRNW